MRNLQMLLATLIVGVATVACGGSEMDSETGVGTLGLSAEGCNCPAVIDPVCGVDGKTYGNSCEAACAGVEVKFEGSCETVTPPKTGVHGAAELTGGRDVCTAQWDPVCGVDGNTYGNDCEARVAGVEIDYKGECRPTMCTAQWDPVCGVDGKTYGNDCEARVAGVEIKHKGACDLSAHK